MYLKALSLIAFVTVVMGKDFAIGMFKSTDILVTQDIVFKERIPFQETTLKYGKMFACSITYFRVADRLGYGDGPKVQVIRGGLNKKYIVVKLWSFNQPIAATIQAGCQAPPITTPAIAKESEEVYEDESDGATADEDDYEEDESTKSDAEGEDEEEAEETNTEANEEEEEAAADDEPTTEASDDEGEGEANENESLRRKNLIIK